ncbi:family 43 glycosylhydrolase [Microbacterium testaceum]|uniref:family 43 glycosylhydrolase n=1 Tax=Microbacterium testaceum TaxID=2033 RepID=UPI0034483C83
MTSSSFTATGRERPILWRTVVALGAFALVLAGLIAAPPANALSGETRLHDPSLITVGSCTYAFSTGFENDPNNAAGAVMVYRTCDTPATTNWVKVGNTWASTPAWITQKLGKTPPNIWAPDINFFNGKYYLYYGASVWGTSSAVMGLLTATDPAGPWTDEGMVTDVNYPIDPDVVRGGDNRLYVSWGSWTGGAVYMHVVDETTGKLSTSDNNLWKIATGVEGVSIHRDGDYFYLYGSKGLCCSGASSTYYTTVARSTSVTGPYTDMSGKSMVDGGGTVVLKGTYPRVAAGGGDVFTNGSSAFFGYHYYDATNNGRESLDIRPLSYANGWPVLGAPLGKTELALQVAHSSQCLDVWGLSTSEAAPVNQGSCNGGANQRWTLQATGSSYKIINVNSGKCLAPKDASTSAGAVMVQVTCADVAVQKWNIAAATGGYNAISNAASGLCLEVYGNNTGNGTAANLWWCNGGDNQRWLEG